MLPIKQPEFPVTHQMKKLSVSYVLMALESGNYSESFSSKNQHI